MLAFVVLPYAHRHIMPMRHAAQHALNTNFLIFFLCLMVSPFCLFVGLNLSDFHRTMRVLFCCQENAQNSVNVSPYRTKPGTDLIKPFSRTQAGCPVAGATQSVRPAAFAADRTSALTIQATPACCSGSPSTSPNCTSQIPSALKSLKEFATRQTPSETNAAPLLRTTVCGVKFMNFINLTVYYCIFALSHKPRGCKGSITFIYRQVYMPDILICYVLDI